MITKEAMCVFMETAREQKKLSWTDTSKLAFEQLHFGRLDRPYSNSGFCTLVTAYTGRKWGRTNVRRKPEHTPTTPSWWEEVETSNLSPEVKRWVMNICSLVRPPHRINRIRT